MTTTADLIAEARKLDLPDCVCKSYPTGDKVCQFHREAAFEMRTLLPQLADALEAVTRELGDVAIEAAAARYQCETAQARLTKVRERAIHREAECHLCGATWYEPYEDRDHQPTACPARRMEPGT